MRAGRKNLKRDALDGVPEPELGHVLMRVVSLRGSNVIEAENAAGENTLCLLPAKFSKTIWIKTGNFIFVDEADREKAIVAGSKVTGSISRVLFEDQVRALRKSSWWPEYFDKAPQAAGSTRGETLVSKLERINVDNEEEDDEDDDDDGLPPLEANGNRQHAMSMYAIESDSSSDEETSDVDKGKQTPGS